MGNDRLRTPPLHNSNYDKTEGSVQVRDQKEMNCKDSFISPQQVFNPYHYQTSLTARHSYGNCLNRT